MKCRKLMAVVLTACMLITLMPTLPAAAAGKTAIYKRANPEFAVLNAKNGSNNKFYDTLLHDTKDADDKLYTAKDEYAYLNYNSASKLFGIDYEDHVSGCSSATKQKTYKYTYDESAVLYKLSMPSGNLEMNFSTTMHNNRHSHSVSKWLQEEITAYTEFNLSAGTLYLHENSSNYDMDDKRVGNYNFSELKPSSAEKKEIKLWVRSPSLKYGDDGEKTCNCESYANKTVVAFRDARTPKLMAVTFFNGSEENTYYKAGDTVKIELAFDEPIRFADDSASGKGDLYINLLLEGSSEGNALRAYLTKLDNNKLYFEYEIPAKSTIDKKITSISLAPLAGSDIALKQVIGGNNFTITAPSGEESTGYSTTTCYITDLAGNPLLSSASDKSSNRGVSAYIDCDGPSLAKIDVSANTNNSEINAIIDALNTSDNSDSASGDSASGDSASGDSSATERDKNNSELYLAPGDSLDYTIYMNEYLAGMIPDGDYSEECINFYAKTNLLDASGNPVYIRSRYCCKTTLDGKQYGQGASDGYVSSFWMETLTIKEGYTYASSSDTQIMITEAGLAESVTEDEATGVITVTGTGKIKIKDTCGNESTAKFSGSTVENLNTLTYYLDTELPIVTTDAAINKSKSTDDETYYTPTEEKTSRDGTEITGFRFPIKLSDSSGVNGIAGYFAWKNDSSDSILYPYSYEYTVTTGDAQLPADAVWKSATMSSGYANCFKEFTQVADSNIWIHIRPLEDENIKYNVLNSRICVAAQDYAGNKARTSVYYDAKGNRIELNTTDFALDWVLESEPPEITRANTKKDASSGNGILYAGLYLYDDTGVDKTKVYYLWADTGTETPAETAEWIQATVTGDDEKAVESCALKEVQNGSSWSQELWVKASDINGNTIIKNLGEYSYSLEAVNYSIEYDTDITSSPRIMVRYLTAPSSGNVALVFMIKVPNTTTDAEGYDDYYVKVLGSKSGYVNRYAFLNYSTQLTNGKDMDFTHMKVKTTTDGAVSYEFKTVGNSASDISFINSLRGGTSTYSGNMNVTIISGTQDAFAWDTTDANIPVSAGKGSYTVSTDEITLKVSSPRAGAPNAFENVTGTGSPVTLTPLSEIPAEPSGDGSSWTPGSYTSLSTLVGLTFRAQIGADKYGWDYEDVDWKNSYVEIQKSGVTINKIPLKASPDQTVTISEGDFFADSGSGYYEIRLVLNCKIGKDYSSEKTTIFVDTTEASDFEITGITYMPYQGFKSAHFYHNISETTLRISPAGEGNVLYLPTSPAGVGGKATNHMQINAPDVETGSVSGRYYGAYKYKIWNVTGGIDLAKSEENAYIATNNTKISITTVKDAAEYDAALTESQEYVYLIKNKLNTLAVQLVKANGNDSEIKYYNIYPTDSSVKGSLSASRLANGTDVVKEGDLIFTPAGNADMNGAHVYVSVEIARTSSSETNEEVKTRYAQYKPYAVYDTSDASKAAIVLELTVQADGTYRCSLLPGDNWYHVHSVDKYGNVWVNISFSGGAESYKEVKDGNYTMYVHATEVRVDTAAPQIELIEGSQKESDGTYEAKFKITDLSLNAKKSTSETGINKYYANDLDIALSIDDAHAEAIGISPGGTTSLHIESESARPAYYSAEKTWKLSENEVSKTGVYEISYNLIQNSETVDDITTYEDAYIELTVKGATGYDRTAGDGKVNFTLNVAASDIFGNTGTQSVQYTDADNVTPKAYTTGDNAPKYKRIGYNIGKYTSKDDCQTMLTFNAPVQPSASWICPEPKGYSKEQADAFPITTGGDYEIGYTDVFGNHWTQNLAIPVNAITYPERVDLNFVINGVKRDASEVLPTDLTNGSLTITAKIKEEKSLYSCNFLTTDADGELCFLSEAEDANYNKPAGWNYNSSVANEKKITLTENKTIYLCTYYGLTDGEAIDIEYVKNKIKNFGIIPIHITNIANGNPTAEPLFYFEEFGDTYTKDTLPKDSDGKVKTTGAVTVSYKANRAVTSTGDSGSNASFRYDGKSSHAYEFKFKDSLGNEGTLKGSLEDYGIELTEPKEEYADMDAPMVNVDILAKRFGAYKSAEAFSVPQDITSSDKSTSSTAKANMSSAVTTAFENASYVQDYNLRVRVDDYSDYKIVLLKDEPASSLTYSKAKSDDDITDVSLSGNVVSISKDARTQGEWSQFTIAVVDNAKADSAATADNYTYFTVKKSDIEKWFDNTAPTLSSEVIATELYSRIEYVTFNDTADDGSENPNDGAVAVNGMEYSKVGSTSASSSAEAAADAAHVGWFKRVHTTNETTHVNFYDSVGNTNSGSVGVTGIDDTKPVLSVEWSPCGIGSDGKPDETTPISKISGPVNTPVTAVVESTIPIYYVNVYVASNDGWEEVYFENMRRGTQTDSEFLYRDGSYGIKCEGTTNRVTVKFTEDNRVVKVIVRALNGQTAEMLLELGDGVIKTTAPTFNVTQKELYRSKSGGGSYSVPYAVQITMEEANGESVYYNGDTRDASGNRKTYSSGDNAYKTTVYKNGTYSYIFTDKAGNVTTANVKVENIDSTAPTLTVSPENTSSLMLTNKDTEVKITPDEDVTLSWKTAAGAVKSAAVAANKQQAVKFDQNGVYAITATDKAGNSKSVYVTIGNISRIIPNISFDEKTIFVRQGTAKDDPDFKAKLEKGVNVWSINSSAGTLTWTYDISALDLSKKGVQNVIYTVTDKAGNTNTATRFVRIYDKDLPAIMIDGNFVENGSTYTLTSGTHKLTMDKLKEITSGESEPYTVKIKKGMATAGQMKKYKSDVSLGSDGSFSLSKGFYTLYVVTQSRSAFIATLYVEK